MKRILLTLIVILILFMAGAAHAQNIEYVGSTYWSNMNGIAIRGTYAFCVFPEGLMVLDVSSPAGPSLVSQFRLTGHAQNIELQGGLAYTEVNDSMLFIIDISDPANPEIVSDNYSRDFIDDIFVRGNFAYLIVNYPKQLQIVDISNPANPSLVSAVALTSGSAVFVEANYAYIANDIGLVVMDVSNPSDPLFYGLLNLNSLISDISISGNHAYLVNPREFYSVDITNPGSPILEGNCVTQIYPGGLCLSGNHAFIYGLDGLEAINVSDPLHPVSVGIYGSHYFVESASVVNGYAFISEDNVGLLTLNVANPDTPEVIACYYTNQQTTNLSISGDFAYVLADQPDTAGRYKYYFEVLDISERSYPQELSKYQIPDKAEAVSVSGEYAYIADSDSGLLILNISNPAVPFYYGRYSCYASHLQIIGNYLYLATPPDLNIIDISSPANPTLIGRFEETDEYSPVMVSVFGNYAYLISEYGGEIFNNYELNVLSIVDVHNPVLIETQPLDFEPNDLLVVDNYAFISSVNHGFPGALSFLFAYDISIPESPTQIDTLSFPGNWSSIDISGNYAVVGAEYVNIVDISDPANLTILHTFQPIDYVRDIQFMGEYIYVAANSFQILNFYPTGVESGSETPTGFFLSQNYPNPFNTQTAIQYSLPKESLISINIFDILGRKIGTLTEGLKPAGEHQALWDASEQSSGIYFYRIKAGDKVETKKMVLLK